MRLNTSLVLGPGRWTSDALRITCVDAYTGERCVITREANVSIPRAVAASSAVPGIFAPQPIDDRVCMDGGVSGTGTHLDLFGGAKRVLILALTDGADVSEGMMTLRPEDGQTELSDLEHSGTTVMLRTPAKVDLLELMSPSSVPEALAMGAHDFASSTDAREIRKHFGRFDLILSTVAARLDWTTYLQTLRANGTLCLLGIPPGMIMQFPPSLLITGQRSITGSDIGGRAVIREMLRFVTRHKIAPQIQRMPMSEANAGLTRLRQNQVRYRLVLER